MRHELVVCTRNRVDDLRRCLASSAGQLMLPDRTLVVDSSDTDATQRLVEEFAERTGLAVTYVRANPGLTLQRNVALEQLAEATDVVHFVDDDTILDPAYLREIMTVFEAYPEAAGVGGRISNQPHHAPRWYRLAFLLDSRREGTLLGSGVNVHNFTGERPQRVEWLTGCAMSYRRRAIAGLRFDERRTGGGMGEDVDFSARVGMREGGLLMWTPSAVLEHVLSPVNREGAIMVARRRVRNRWRLASDGVGRVNRGAVLYALIGEVCVDLGVAGIRRSGYYARLAVGCVAGVSDIVRRIPV